jgi:hypothetical protein
VAKYGLGFVPGGTFVRQVAEQAGLAGDMHSSKGQKRVARKAHKTAAKHGASMHHGGKKAGKHHAETALGLPPIDLSGAAQGLAEHFGMGGAMAAAHAAAGGGGFGHRRRSINPANAKALRRSMRRLESFSKLAHRVMSFKTHHKLKSPRKGRR